GAAWEPIINSLIRRYEVDVNILFANMTEIQNTTLGNMILQMHGDHAVIDRAADFITSQGVEITEVEA
ncbi:NIL domain-containing protein, partial [Paenibacillus riograndensis]|uniref:NIL domain-containing protein n=1 Tax=Paenibacillus riograndensis TaxID=483937 RepID=UPI000585BF74